MRKLILTGIIVAFFGLKGISQPFALSLNNVNGSPYTCTALDDLGTYKRLRVQATQNSSAATWELPQICSFPGNVWRPYTAADATPIPFNVVIPPVPGTYAALWNSGNGGVPGKLSAITNGNYYTFNVENITCSSGICNSPHIGVLETSYLPVTFPSVTQNPLADAVGTNVPVTITVTSSAPPVENVFLRYTINEYVNTTIVLVTFTGTTGTAVIPGFPVGTTVKYYIYSTNKSQALIESEVAQYGEIVHDMSTLDWNVNTGSNYPYIVLDIAPVTVQYFKGFRQSNYNNLSWKLDCSNMTASTVVLERSADGRNFNPIYSMQVDPSRCNDVFSYRDVNFGKGLNYYRLNVHNTDSRSHFSNIVALLNAGKGFEIVNLMASADGNVKFTVSAAESANTDISIIDMSGRTLRKIHTILASGSNDFNMTIPGLSNGVYALSVSTQSGITKTSKFMVR